MHNKLLGKATMKGKRTSRIIYVLIVLLLMLAMGLRAPQTTEPKNSRSGR